MALITTTTPNMIGGVSQQPAALRLPNQAEEQDNALATITEGLKKRVNTEHVGTLASAPTSVDTSAWHTIYRDGTEKYAVAASSKDIRVFDIADNGAAEAIYKKNGDFATYGPGGSFDYVATVGFHDIEMITLADYTLVLNKNVQPKMLSTTTTARNPEALVFVQAGNYATKYIITYKQGLTTGTVTFLTKNASNANHSPNIQTDYIAAALHHGMTAASLDLVAYPGLSRTGTWPLSGYTLAKEGSCIWVQKNDTTAFSMKADDSVGSTNLTVLQNEVQSFTSLPTVAPNGFVAKIDGFPEQGGGGFSAYYVAFRTTSDTTTGGPGTAAFEDGVWEETVAPGVEYQIDPATMPHALIRLANGKFIWTPLDGIPTSNSEVFGATYQIPGWGERQAGDDTTNSRPPWLQKSDATEGEPIRGMSFFADRLVFLSGTDVSLSESGQYFSWFRTTVTSLLDSARISVTAAHTRVNLLNFAIPLREQLVIFTEFSQFALRGSADGTLTPTNVWITVATDYETSSYSRPVSSKRSIFASARRGDAWMIRELFDSGTGQRPQLDAAEVTAQAPTYIQGDYPGLEMVVSTIEDMLVVLPRTSGVSSNKLYIFKYMINGDERVQSAWSRFIFFNCDILSMSWIDQDLFLIVNRGGQVSLEKLNFESYLKDDDSEFRVLLDRRLSDESAGVSSSYSASLDQTTFVVPYTQTTAVTTQVVTRQAGATHAGSILAPVSNTGTLVVVEGDHTSTPVWIGEKYDMNYVFSQLNLRSSYAQTANRAVVSAGSSLRMRYGSILFEDSGYFKITVTPKDQMAYEYPMTGQILSSSNNQLGQKGIESGNFRFPMMGEYQTLTVAITSDAPFPARLISAEWEANYHTRNRRF